MSVLSEDKNRIITIIAFIAMLITGTLYLLDLPPVPQLISIEISMFGKYSPKGTCIGLWLIVFALLLAIYLFWKIFRTPMDEE